jgi:hypothetical protein
MSIWDAYLLPEDVGADDAAQVLAFLNQTRSPEDLAEAIEFVDETDIGIRLARRILAARDALGGFSSLEQVYAVPLIGPERFTELVVALSAARPPRGGETIPEAVISELRSIRSTVVALQSALLPTAVVRLWSVQPQAWLGQPVRLLAHVTDHRGHALINYPLTLTTNWGELRGRSGTLLVRGASLRMHTNHLGMVKASLLPVLSAPITEIQQKSLESQLLGLPVAAATPARARDALNRLAHQYRADGNTTLRAAIDGYFRAYASTLADADTRSGGLGVWPLWPATVQCFVHEPESSARGTVTLGVGVHTVSIRNWLNAFITVFETQLAGDGRLRDALDLLERDDKFVVQALGRVQAFVALEKGAVGNALRHTVARRALDEYVQGRLVAFPADLQRDVLGDMQTASKTLADGGLSVFNAVQSVSPPATRTTESPVIDDLAARLNDLEEVVVVQDDLTRMRSDLQSASDAAVGALQSQLAASTAALADVDARLARVDADVRVLGRNLDPPR